MEKDLNYYIHLGFVGKQEVVYAKNAIREYGKALGTIPDEAEKARNAIVKWGSMTTVISSAQSSIQQITGAMNGLIQKANAATESQTKLQTIMKERMSATDEDIKSINDLISKQTELGVVSGTVQRAGMQQLATFASQKQTLQELLPAMNNLLVQQNGLNSTTENATSIANLMGKALMGNSSALTRVGITLTDTQKELIKTGDEGTRAKTIAEAITQNVGEMNEEMARTDAGKAKQAANEFAGMQSKIGALLSPLQSFITKFGQFGYAVTGVIQLTTSLKGLAGALGLTTLAQRAANSVWTYGTKNIQALRLAMVEYTWAQEIEGKSALSAAISTQLFKNAIRGLLIATGVGALIVALGMAMEALTLSTDSANESINDSSKALNNNERLSKEAKSASDELSTSVSSEKNRINALTDVIHSNTASLADKKEAIKQVKSIIPDYVAEIDSEGRVHDNASTAIYNHIEALDALQRAIAAYKVGQSIQDELAKASEASFQANRKVSAKQNNVNKVDEEMQNHPERYYGSTVRLVAMPGTQETMDTRPLNRNGLAKLHERDLQLDALDAAKREKATTDTALRQVQNEADGYKEWQQSYIMEGARTSAQRQLRQRAFNSAIMGNGEYNASSGYLFGRGINQLSPDEEGKAGTGKTGTTRHGHSGTTHTGTGHTVTTNATTTDKDEDKPLSLIENPANRTDYENNSKYYQQEIDKLNAANDADKTRIATLNKEKSAVDDIISQYDKLGTTEDKMPEPELPKFEPGSVADYSAQLQKLNTRLENVNLTEAERNKLLKERKGLQDSLDGIQAVQDANDVDFSVSPDKDNTDYDSLLERLNKRRADLLKNVRPKANIQMPSLDIKSGKTTDFSIDFSVDGMDDLAEVARLIDRIRNRKKKLDEENTKKRLIDQYGGEMVTAQQNIMGLAKSFQTCGATADTVGAAIAFAGQELQQLGGQGAAAKAGAIASALGQLALGYAYATSEAGKELGPWGWIAFGLAGMAQLISMVNTISSFATGGIVPGTSYTGDKVVAHVNSGEMILNARQQARLFAIANGNLTPSLPAIASNSVSPNVSINTTDVSGSGMVSGGKVVLKVKGRDLVGVIENDGKIGKKIGRHTVKLI